MRAALNIARLHVLLTLRDPAATIILLGVPVVLMIIIGFAVGDEVADVDILMDVVDQDQSEFSQDFIQQLQASERDTDTIFVCVYGADNIPEPCDLEDGDSFQEVGEDRLKENEVSATIVIPAGFGDILAGGGTATLEYRSDEQLNAQTVARTTVDTALNRFAGSILIANVGTQIGAEEFQAYRDEAEQQTAFTQLRERALAQMQSPAAVVKKESSGEEIVVGVGARQSVPGTGSMFVLFGLLGLAQTLVSEREQGTLQRLFTVPAPKFYVVLGKILGAFFFGVLQYSIFIAFGALVLDVDWGGDVLAIVLLVASYCLAGTALGFALATLVRTSNQAGGLSSLLGLTLAPLGGAWWPLDIVPDFMRIVGHISPIAWVMDGFKELIYYEGGLLDILPMVGVLLLMTALFMAFAVWRFRYE